ncbi:hypothetical protein ZWY2020_015178 [Hordeum vulgare]|nr:hypothetical protein ZWY2020_015178 [Hordeum vulgare]
MAPAVRVQLAGLGEDNRREGLCKRPSPHPLRPLLEAQFELATWRSQIRGGSGSPTSFPRRNGASGARAAGSSWQGSVRTTVGRGCAGDRHPIRSILSSRPSLSWRHGGP